MNDELVRQFRDRWQAVTIIEVGEQRATSVALRWQQMNAIFCLAQGLQIPIANFNQEEEVVWQRWAKLKGSQI